MDYVAEPTHGPLPALMLVLTVTTGVVDAVSILSLGRVFVANMTGNVVFIGFALAGAPGFSLAASLIALLAFLAGAGSGGLIVGRFGAHRGRLLLVATAVELLLLTCAAAILSSASEPFAAAVRNVVVALAASALGLQNAAVRRLAVPDFTTTVLTMTLTGIAADLRAGNQRVATRRVSSVVAMLLGAVAGADLVLQGHAGSALFLACALVAAEVVAVIMLVRHDAPWHHPTPQH